MRRDVGEGEARWRLALARAAIDAASWDLEKLERAQARIDLLAGRVARASLDRGDPLCVVLDRILAVRERTLELAGTDASAVLAGLEHGFDRALLAAEAVYSRQSSATGATVAPRTA